MLLFQWLCSTLLESLVLDSWKATKSFEFHCQKNDSDWRKLFKIWLSPIILTRVYHLKFHSAVEHQWLIMWNAKQPLKRKAPRDSEIESTAIARNNLTLRLEKVVRALHLAKYMYCKMAESNGNPFISSHVTGKHVSTETKNAKLHIFVILQCLKIAFTTCYPLWWIIFFG